MEVLAIGRRLGQYLVRLIKSDFVNELSYLKAVGTPIASQKVWISLFSSVKVKVLTSWSLIWLVVTVLLVAGGALNLSQRAFHDLPPTDGVLWVQKDDGIYAEKVMPGLAASRAGISPGEGCSTVSLDGEYV